MTHREWDSATELVLEMSVVPPAKCKMEVPRSDMSWVQGLLILRSCSVLLHEQLEHILMTEEDREDAIQYFLLLREEETASKKRQQEYVISLRKKKLRTE